MSQHLFYILILLKKKMIFTIVDSPVITSGDRLLIISPLENQSWRVCHTIRLWKIFKKRKYEKIREIFSKVLDTGKGNDMFKLSIEALQNGKFQGMFKNVINTQYYFFSFTADKYI